MPEIRWINQNAAQISFTTPNERGVMGERGYPNSPNGRELLELDCPPKTVKEVFAVWGDSPTVEEKTDGIVPHIDPNPTQSERIAALEGAVFELMKGGQANV